MSKDTSEEAEVPFSTFRSCLGGGERSFWRLLGSISKEELGTRLSTRKASGAAQSWDVLLSQCAHLVELWTENERLKEKIVSGYPDRPEFVKNVTIDLKKLRGQSKEIADLTAVFFRRLLSSEETIAYVASIRMARSIGLFMPYDRAQDEKNVSPSGKNLFSQFGIRMLELQHRFDMLLTCSVDSWGDLNVKVKNLKDRVGVLEAMMRKITTSLKTSKQTYDKTSKLLTRQVATGFEKKLIFTAFKDLEDDSRALELSKLTLKEVLFQYRWGTLTPEEESLFVNVVDDVRNQRV